MKCLYKNNNWLATMLLLILAIVACKKEGPIVPEPVDPDNPSENEIVNDWILDNMQDYYYWNTQIPVSPNFNLDPEAFFYSLLNGNYTADGEYLSGEDRFSWIQESAVDLGNSLQGLNKSFGYEVQLYYLKENSDQVIGIVLYTYPGSEAVQDGLKRGDVIGVVNGATLNDKNYRNLLNKEGPQTITIGSINNNGDFVAGEDLSITPVELQEDPVYLDSVYAYNGKKIGYLVYNSFIGTPANADPGTTIYDDKLDDVFADFKSQGVNELILDLRYNLGGSVLSAIKLASLIVPGLDTNNVFALYDFNDVIDPVNEGVVRKFVLKAANINAQKLYVLVSGRTASASELIINGLKPYMEVVLIGGERTVGKNVGSYTIYDETEEIKWGLQPIVLKIFNSLGQSDFTQGFVPDYGYVSENNDNNIRENYAPFGNVNERFLNKALEVATGAPVITSLEMLRVPSMQSRGQSIGTSLTRKPGAGEMYIDKETLPGRE